MQLIRQVAPENFNFFLIGDDHEGTILRYDKGWNRMCHMVNSEYEGVKTNFVWHHGDPIEGILIDDKRYDPETEKPDKGKRIPTVLRQIEVAVQNIDPIRSQLIGMNEGNHTWKQMRVGPITEMICERLGIKYGTWTSVLSWNTRKGRYLFKTFHAHGKKQIRSQSGTPKRRREMMEFILKSQLQERYGSAILMCKGHTHKLLISNPESELYMTDDGKEDTQHDYIKANQTDDYIPPDLRWYVNTGSFMKLYGKGISGYAEQAEYGPVELGFAVAVVRNGKVQKVNKEVP